MILESLVNTEGLWQTPLTISENMFCIVYYGTEPVCVLSQGVGELYVGC